MKDEVENEASRVLQLATAMVANAHDRVRRAVCEAAAGCHAAGISYEEASAAVIAAAQKARLGPDEAAAAFKQTWTRADWDVFWRARRYRAGGSSRPRSMVPSASEI